MTVTTDGGTQFDVEKGQVTITRHDQPTCTIPLADLREFLGLLDFEDNDE